MANQNEMMDILESIHELLVPISACFMDQYQEIQKRQVGAKLAHLRSLLNTAVRRRVFPYLFDPRGLSQVEIANEADTTQATVSRLISLLLREGFIDQKSGDGGPAEYVDTYDLRRLIEVADE
jgi:CRP-like cAMP-binding protein